jgi:hypothetical protein
VVLSDGDAGSIANCSFNLALNGVQVGPLGQGQGQQQRASPSLEVLRWEEGGGGRQPELILGADVLYTPEMVHLLLAVVAGLLAGSEQEQEQGGQAGASEQQQQQQQQQQGAGPGCSCEACAAPRWQRCALVSTMVRGEANQQLFLGSARGYGLALQRVCWPPGAGGEGGGACCRIHHHADLEAARPRLKLYRLTRM